MRHLLTTRDLDLEFVQQLFTRAEKLKRMRGVLSSHDQTLDGETVANLFWEVSTRTRISFELAAVRLGARVVNLIPKESSVAKGEGLYDTVMNLRALGCRFFVLRHPESGEVSRLIERVTRAVHIINGGDGTNEHPSQAILDAFTIREYKKTLDRIEVAIVGDILRSRVAHSNIHLLPRMGCNVRLSGPAELLPKGPLPSGVVIVPNLQKAIEGADVVMALRLQRERANVKFAMSESDYHDQFGLTAERLTGAKPDAIVMHPGPMNRGLEIDSDVADGPQSAILRQAENGLFMRMAIFEALRGDLG